MRIRASKTRYLRWIAVALCGASCASTPPAKTPRPHSPVPGQLLVAGENITLRQNEFLELHALLAAGARNEAEITPELEPARAAYTRVLGGDDDDALLAATSRAIAQCSTEACAVAVLDPHGLGTSFAHALPTFVAREWDERAAVAWAALERALAAFGEQAGAVLKSVARDLGVTWETTSPPVDIVAASPPPGRTALITPMLAARGSCFAQARADNDDVRYARIVDCVTVRALLAGTSPLRAAFGERFFTVLAVHAVAATVTRLEAKHLSVDRRSIAAVEPAMLEFITREWHGGPVSPDLPTRWEAHRAARASVPAGSASD